MDQPHLTLAALAPMVATTAATIVAAGIARATHFLHLTFMSNGSFRCTGRVGIPSGVEPCVAPRRVLDAAGGAMPVRSFLTSPMGEARAYPE